MDRPVTRTPTITDVAARAGVSLATVSRVLNANRRVDPGMADRVRKAASELRYTASPVARSLVLGRTGTVAVVVPDLENPTFTGVLRGLGRAAGRDGQHVLVADSAESTATEMALATATRRRCDGLVLCSPRMPTDDLRELVDDLRPVVLVNRELPADAGVPVVAADYRSGLTALLQLLASDGHRELIYLAGAPQSASNTQRLDAVAELGRTRPDVRVTTVPGGVSFADGYAAVDRVLGSGATGVLAFNDLVAMGLLSALAERGVRVPDELSVTGFDDIPFAPYLTPSLTTAAVPVTELGEQAWARMADLLAGRTPGPPLRLRPRLERRNSTGPVPDAGRTRRETSGVG